MGVGTANPPGSQPVYAMQVEKYSNLPAPDSVQAWEEVWVEQNEGVNPFGLYICVLTNPQGNRAWAFVGGGGGSSSPLPTVRFVVGKAALNLIDPGMGTYLTIASALAAVAAYQAANPGAPATIELHADRYVENVSLPPGVSMMGLSGTAETVWVDGIITITGGGVAAQNGLATLQFNELVIHYTSNGQRCDLDRVEALGPVTIDQLANGTFGVYASFDANLSLGLSISVPGFLVCSTLSGRINLLNVSVAPGGTCLFRAYSAIMSADAGPALSAALSGPVFGEFVGCSWYNNAGATLPIISLAVGAQAKITGGQRSNVSLPYIATSLDGTGSLWMQDVAGSTDPTDIDAGVDPALTSKAALPTANGQAFSTDSFNVDGLGPVLILAKRAVDTLELTGTQSVPVDPIRANNAFALCQLPLSTELVSRKRVKILNTANASDPTAASVAIIPTPGELINSILSGTAANITSVDYLILAPGSSVELSAITAGWQIAS